MPNVALVDVQLVYAVLGDDARVIHSGRPKDARGERVEVGAQGSLQLRVLGVVHVGRRARQHPLRLALPP